MTLNWHGDMDFFIRSTIGLISIIDPLGAIPILLSLTTHRNKEQVRAIVRTVVISCLVALFAFALTGNAVLDFFGISVAAFRTSGGILILLMAIQMIEGEPRRSKQTVEERAEAAEKENIAVVPIAIPLLVGPGTMSTTILLSREAHNMELRITLYLSIIVVIVATWICLGLSNILRRILGDTGIRIATRIMGLLLAALAVQFISDGMRELFPGIALARS